MSFDLVVNMKDPVRELRDAWQRAINAQGFEVEILPGFDPDDWGGGFLPIKLVSQPTEFLFGLPQIVQVSGFEVGFSPNEARFRTASSRTISELTLQCYGAATLAELTNGTYFDPQEGATFSGESAIQRARAEVLGYEPYLDAKARRQHRFTDWKDYGVA